MFNYLLDDLPDEILGCPIRTGHKEILAIIEQMEDIKEPREKALALLQGLFVKEIPNEENLFEDYINPFLEGGKYHRYKDDGKTTLSWYQDSQEIYAGFYHTYNIDLIKTNLHWYVFCALFAELPATTKIKELMELRSWKASKNDSKEYIKAMRERQIKARILPKEKLQHGRL